MREGHGVATGSSCALMCVCVATRCDLVVDATSSILMRSASRAADLRATPSSIAAVQGQCVRCYVDAKAAGLLKCSEH